MKFNIKSNNGNKKMYEGMIITYTVTPVIKYSFELDNGNHTHKKK